MKRLTKDVLLNKKLPQVDKYISLAGVIRAEHKVKTEIVPLVIGALCYWYPKHNWLCSNLHHYEHC